MTATNWSSEQSTESTATDATQEKNPILEVIDVSYSFGDVPVLNDISLGFERGALTCLLGPNGSGKTTLLRVLLGVLSPTDGDITYRGPVRSRELGYVPQQPSFRSGFTVAETIAFYTALVGESGGEEYLDRVGMSAAADRRVEALSGGMIRLLGVAQAMIGDPAVVVLDEPATGLDPSMRARVFEIARDLADDGRAVVVSSHDTSLVETYADQVVVLDGGQLVTRGSPATLCADAKVETLHGVFEEHVDRSDDDQLTVPGKQQ